MRAVRYPADAPDWVREHGGDLIPVKLIDLLCLVARLEQIGRGDMQSGLLVMRLISSDLPRLRAYLPERALEEL